MIASKPTEKSPVEAVDYGKVSRALTGKEKNLSLTKRRTAARMKSEKMNINQIPATLLNVMTSVNNISTLRVLRIT